MKTILIKLIVFLGIFGLIIFLANNIGFQGFAVFTLTEGCPSTLTSSTNLKLSKLPCRSFIPILFIALLLSMYLTISFEYYKESILLSVIIFLGIVGFSLFLSIQFHAFLIREILQSALEEYSVRIYLDFDWVRLSKMTKSELAAANPVFFMFFFYCAHMIVWGLFPSNLVVQKFFPYNELNEEDFQKNS